MNNSPCLFSDSWGYKPRPKDASDLIEELCASTETAVKNYGFTALETDFASDPDHKEFVRVTGLIPVTAEFFDAFFHGPTGYRARYAQSIEVGEQFNAYVITGVGDILLPQADRHPTDLSSDTVTASLRGDHSKIWFPKQMTDLSSRWWDDAEPTIKWPRWVQYWSREPKPHKGLLAFVPEEPAILINGTFIHKKTHEVWNQKPDRSRQIHETGWT